MPLDFPLSPAINDTYSLGDYTWKWDGNGWANIETTTVATGPTGPTGATGVVMASDPLAYNSATKTISLKIKGSGGLLGNNSGLYIDTSVIPALTTNNTFTGSNVFSGSTKINGKLTGSSFDLEAKPIDDSMVNLFNGKDSVFLAKSQGLAIKDLNPFRLLINLNGIIQSVTLPNYLWENPFVTSNEVWLDSTGYLHFSKVPATGSTFNGRVLAGEAVNTKTGIYPFKPMDIILGD